MFTKDICKNKTSKNIEEQSLSCMAIDRNGTKHSKRRVSITTLKSEKKQLLAQLVNQIVAATVDLPPEKLLQCSRGKADAARARQISIYLMHTTLSFSYTEIGKIYSKDRTTISHACHVIEDLRDNESFDLKLNRLERMIGTVLSLSDEKFGGTSQNG